jgi:hypothetical protein
MEQNNCSIAPAMMTVLREFFFDGTRLYEKMMEIIGSSCQIIGQVQSGREALLRKKQLFVKTNEKHDRKRAI